MNFITIVFHAIVVFFCNLPFDFRYHRSPIETANSIQFSPDDSRLLISCNDSTARILDATSGNILLTLSGHTKKVNTAEYSPDGKLIATTSNDKTLKIWNAITGLLVDTKQDKVYEITNAKFSPDGKRMLTTSGNKIEIWKVDGFALEHTINGDHLFIDACFSPDSKFIFSASSDKTVRKWVIGYDQPVATMARHKQMVYSVSCSNDGKYVISSSLTENDMYVWDARQGYLICSMPVGLGVRRLQCGKNSTYFYADKNYSTSIINFADCKLLTEITADLDDMTSISALSSDGARVVTLSISGILKLWDAKTGAELKKLN